MARPSALFALDDHLYGRDLLVLPSSGQRLDRGAVWLSTPLLESAVKAGQETLSRCCAMR
jgi:hypothetical protein